MPIYIYILTLRNGHRIISIYQVFFFSKYPNAIHDEQHILSLSKYLFELQIIATEKTNLCLSSESDESFKKELLIPST